MSVTTHDLKMFLEAKKRVEDAISTRTNAKIEIKKLIMPLSLQKTLSKGKDQVLSQWEGFPVETGETFKIIS